MNVIYKNEFDDKETLKWMVPLNMNEDGSFKTISLSILRTYFFRANGKFTISSISFSAISWDNGIKGLYYFSHDGKRVELEQDGQFIYGPTGGWRSQPNYYIDLRIRKYNTRKTHRIFFK